MENIIYFGIPLTGIGESDNKGKQGKWRYYSPKGQLLLEITYKNDLKHGLYRGFHKNDNVYIECNYENDVENGLEIYYYETGNVKESGTNANGEYHPLEYWDEQGNQLMRDGTGKKIEVYGAMGLDIYEQYFENGKFIKEVKISEKYSIGKFKPKKDDSSSA